MPAPPSTRLGLTTMSVLVTKMEKEEDEWERAVSSENPV